jgi:uncharacterized membrane protein
LDRREGMLLEGLRGLEVSYQAYRELVRERNVDLPPEALAVELRSVEENLMESRLPLHQGLMWVAELRVRRSM